MRRKDPRLIGFLVGFGTVTIIGLVVVASLGFFSTAPSPTLAPTAVPIAGHITGTPSENIPATQEPTPSPLPNDTPSPTLHPPTTEPSSSPTLAALIEYTVREGDTLFDIALAHNIDVETIQAANNLEGETIIPGRVLIIPPSPLPTPTPYLEDDTIIHTVSSGETLIGIAEHYSVTLETIQQTNDLDSETIQPGWQLRIPSANTEDLPASPAEAAPDSSWQPSILTGNLSEGYPLTLKGERFSLHYQPDTPAARAPTQVAALVDGALRHIENKIRVTLEGTFDVYVAGSLFAPDDTALRGRSFSSQRRTFYLYDGSGTPGERRYVITHELTHMIVWQTLGKPSSVMLHEGLSVYTGIEEMEDAGFIPLNHFCAAYHQAGQLPFPSGNRSYLGHIRDLDLYFSAGCFVQHLIQSYGLQSFKQVFASGDYPGVYGYTQSQLEEEWIKTLADIKDDLAFDPEDLTSAVADVTDAYDRLFTNFTGTPAQMSAYRELDQARIAMLQGRFEETQESLVDFEKLLQNR